MSNIKVTATLLESAGWTEAQIDRYYKLLDRKMQRGLSALSVSDRRFYNSALPACSKAQSAIDKAIREGQTRRVSGKQPVETKLHYRYCQADMLNYLQQAELLPGEELAIVIIRQEQMRALTIYQPILDQVDTTRRGQFDVTEAEFLDLAAALGRHLPYDGVAHKTAMKQEFADTWNDRWTIYYDRLASNAVALDGQDALEFRAIVRPAVEQFIRSLPSVRSTVAA
jgi:hypothetical protein